MFRKVWIFEVVSHEKFPHTNFSDFRIKLSRFQFGARNFLQLTSFRHKLLRIRKYFSVVFPSQSTTRNFVNRLNFKLFLRQTSLDKNSKLNSSRKFSPRTSFTAENICRPVNLSENFSINFFSANIFFESLFGKVWFDHWICVGISRNRLWQVWSFSEVSSSNYFSWRNSVTVQTRELEKLPLEKTLVEEKVRNGDFTNFFTRRNFSPLLQKLRTNFTRRTKRNCTKWFVKSLFDY